MGEQSAVGQAMSQALGKLFAIAEAYPELKADANFRDLQDKLSGIEDEIQLSRRYYNGAVRNLNTMIESFPTNLIAKQFGFSAYDIGEVSVNTQDAAPMPMAARFCVRMMPETTGMS